jgi:predicted metal-dependent hydrolase
MAQAVRMGFTQWMQFEFLIRPKRPEPGTESWLQVGTRSVRLLFMRHQRARRYVLRLGPDGAARVTIPRGGSVAEAKQFAEKHISWLEKQLLRQANQQAIPRAWGIGTKILFRGETVLLEAGAESEPGVLLLGNEIVRIKGPVNDLRPAIERHLWRLAARELPARVLELAAEHHQSVKRVTVRNQRSRWGSCSRRGTISLNWRLIQSPAYVRDYIILHELAHLKEMNHSARFWREVARLCPDFAQAERWLKQHSHLMK